VSKDKSSTSFWYQFLHLRLTYYFTYHFFLFCLTTLSLPAFTNSSPRSSTFSYRTAFADYCLHRFFSANPLLFLVFLYFCFCAVR